MKRLYVLLALSMILVSPIYSKKRSNRSSSQSVGSNERKVRGELDKLMNKDRDKLTFVETKRIRELVEQLKRFDKEAAADAEESLFETCCGMSDFEEHEIKAQLEDLFKKPNKSDSKWVSKVNQLLDDLYGGIAGNFGMCSEDHDEQTWHSWLKPYTHFAHKYETITGKKLPQRAQPQFYDYE